MEPLLFYTRHCTQLKIVDPAIHTWRLSTAQCYIHLIVQVTEPPINAHHGFMQAILQLASP